MEYSVENNTFGIIFQLQEVVKLKIRKYAYLRIFSLTTSRSQKFILKQIWNENVPITILIFFLEQFGQYFKKSKNGFPIVFSNLARKGPGFIFMLEC